MNLVELQRKLIAAARADRPSDRVPFAFEKRVMALIKTCPVTDVWAAWSRALWCAAAPCVAIMLVLSAWAFFQPATDNTSSVEFSQQFDTAMLAAVDQSNFPE